MTSARIEYIETAALKPYERNARTHSQKQIEQIAASITEFGFTNPVLINKDNVIIAGHGRVLGAQKLGMHSVPCVRLTHLTHTQHRAYVIADNQIALNAEWDDALFGSELLDLKSLDVDLSLLGVDEHEFNEMMRRAGREGIDEDDVPELKPEAFSQRGDVWLLGDHRLMCGDSASAEDVGRLMAGAKADLCFTSPPYNLGENVGLRNGVRKNMTSAYNDRADSGDDWADMMRRFLRQALFAARECAVNIQLLAGNKTDLLKLFGEYSNQTIDVAVWEKTNPMPAMADGVMTSAYEFIWLLRDEDKPSRRINGASFHRGTFSNVFQCACASGHDASIHGAVFPLAVASHYIANLSAADSLVYDPFLGSGTTLIAAEQLSRRCYAMEISPQYVDVSVRRWQGITGKRARRESDGAEIPDA